MFPAESEPNGGSQTPHFYTGGLMAVLFITALIWDDFPDSEPYLTALCATLGIISFAGVWAIYPRTGGVLATFFASSVLFCLVFNETWSLVPDYLHAAAMVCTFMALDDCLNHTAGISTPLQFVRRLTWRDEHEKPRTQ